MMRLCLTIVFLSMAVYSTAQQRNSNIPWSGIKGMVACVTVRDSAAQDIFNKSVVCSIINAPIDSGYTTHILDDKGNQLSCTYYDKDSILIRRITNQYDDRNNRIETAHWDNDGNLIGTYIFKYDDTGYPTERITYNGADSITAMLELSMKYLIDDYLECYDKQGKRTKMINYMADCGGWGVNDSMIHPISDTLKDTAITYNNGIKNLTVTYRLGKTTWTTLHSFNTNGNEIETIMYNMYGEEGCIIQREYDDQGNILVLAEAEVWEHDYIIGGKKEKYKYDRKGNKTEYKYYELGEEHVRGFSNGNEWRNWYVLSTHTLYDSNNRVREYLKYNRGILQSHWINIFSADGKTLHSLEYDKNNSLQSESYARFENIDDHGNWHKMINWSWASDGYYDNIPRVSYRFIRYHE